jgi:PAS domain S-box-containing protein
MQNQAIISFAVIAALAIGLALFYKRRGPGHISNITRDAVVEGMDDGWMVVNDQNIIVDLNRATEEMIGLPREKIHGQPINTILTDWANIFKSPEAIKELDMRRSVRSQNDWRYLNIRVSKLTDNNNVTFGHLIVWRDITKRKMADDARQRARDELFVLLNAISSAASHSMNLEEFLSESIYQIIYSFRSQAVAVYLLDENKTEDGQQRLLLKSHFGIPPEDLKSINDRPITSTITKWLFENHENQTLVVEDMHGDDLHLYPIIQKMGFSRLAMIPLTVITHQKSDILGCMCLARSEDIPFAQDEIIRLKTISNQISTLIDSDRRRQFAIAVSERQRLMRDLHDSVSQKLYGLLALTEAAQAALEAGSEIIPTQVLARIGDNARQAVREMRLFLYEMQPVDLEEGLVSVLHHRLAAVEGRADIKARLLVDENIVLPKDKEIALYFISQEALNNILRHAHATNVSITLKQTRQNVILEVNDDGNGFDVKSVDQGGLGLRNMRDRTLKMDGKFKIASRAGKGTQISVTVPRKN